MTREEREAKVKSMFVLSPAGACRWLLDALDAAEARASEWQRAAGLNLTTARARYNALEAERDRLREALDRLSTTAPDPKWCLDRSLLDDADPPSMIRAASRDYEQALLDARAALADAGKGG